MPVIIQLTSSPVTHSVHRRWLGTRSYWGFQALGWGAVWAVTTAPLLFAPTQITVQALAASLALVGLLALGSHLLRVILLFLLQRSRGAAGFMVICAAWTFVIGFALTSVYIVLAELLAATDPTIPKGTLEGWGAADYAHTFLIMTFLLMVWIGFYLLVRSYRQQQQDKLDRVRSEVHARDAELRALKAQINPHFLFNSLNSLRALMQPEDERSRATVSRLAALLRASLGSDQESLVPLSRELSMVEGYLEIEKLRHEERLRWKIDASAAARAWPVPPFALQGLVENAIKHGINHIEEGGEIEISAQVIEARLHLDVTNPGFLEAAPRSPGVGLANARARLYLLFGPAASLDLIVPSPGRVQARGRLPASLTPSPTQPLPLP